MSPQQQLLRAGTVVDGLGTPPQIQDILIEDDRIIAIGHALRVGELTETIDCVGRLVTPGFIDLHSHADFTLLAFPSAESAIMQGITTIATGNCGGGVAPIQDHSLVGQVAFAYDPSWDVEVDWLGFGEFAARLNGTAVNVAPLVAHGPIRNYVMGMESRNPDRDEINEMHNLLARCLDEGAFGLSTGLEYQPGIWSDEDELRTLVAEVGSRDRLYATHMRGRADDHAEATSEALRTVRGTGARLQLSHFASRPNARPATSDTAFSLVEQAAHGEDYVGVDTFPEIWGPALLIDLFPEWALEGSPSEVLTRLTSREARTVIADEFDSCPRFLAQVAGYEKIYLADGPGSREFKGRGLNEIASDSGRTVADTCCDLLVAAGEEYRSVAIRHIYATESAIRRTMALPFCSIESDGVVTSGQDEACQLIWNASSYGYVARVLEHYVGEEEFFTLEEAVRRMSSLPATALGLSDRGSIQVGNHADLAIIAPNEIRDRSSADQPARHPNGFVQVFVNGIRAVENGQATGALNGRVLQP